MAAHPPLSSLFESNVVLSQGLFLIIETGGGEYGLRVLRSLLPENGISLYARNVPKGRTAKNIDATTPSTVDMLDRLLEERGNIGNLLVIDCLHALRFGTGIGPVQPFLSSLIEKGYMVGAVIPDVVPNEIEVLCRMASHVALVSDLPSGAAEDVHGIVQVVKMNGRWRRNGKNGIERFRLEDEQVVLVK